MIRSALNATGALFLMASTAYAHEYKLGTLEIVHPHTRETIANAPVAGGYMTIRNTGDKADVLIGGSAGFAGMVQIHEMKMDGDVMKMREVEEALAIPPGGEVVLEPGGYHAMFMQLKESLKAGEKKPVRLEFHQAGTIDVEFNIEAMTPGGDMNQGHIDHSQSGHVSETHAAMDHANMSHAVGSDAEQIAGMLKLAFDRPEAPLTVEPVVISGDWAVAGWAQDSRGGRGLMKKDAQGWFVLMCSGAAFRDAGKLMAAGVPHHDAMSIAAMLEEEEGKLGTAATALFDGFGGMVEVGRAGHHGHTQHKN